MIGLEGYGEGAFCVGSWGLGSGGPRPGRARSVETDEEGESEQSVKVSRWEGGAGRGSVPALLHWVVERTRKNP